MQQPTLVILAAGMASRYGSMKQVQSFGPSGETIMEYSIYDAINAGFGKVVFIIRKEFADAFKAQIEPKIKGKIEIEYVFQELTAYMGNHTLPEDRVKPWGTAHAVLCCKELVKEPFAVINADDFYGRDAFKKAYEFLTTQCNDTTYGIVGYKLRNTLSENGSVSRGVCEVDADSNLLEVNERTKIFRNTEKVIVFEDISGIHPISGSKFVSMNLMCFAPNFIDLSEKLFDAFLDRNIRDYKSEFYLPFVLNHFINEHMGDVKVVPTESQWFGVTYKEDAPSVKASVENLVAENVYPTNLWG
jgi:NDP-sugar pyrophosphorylase family protein